MSMIRTLNWLKGPEAKAVEKIDAAFPATAAPDEQNIVSADTQHLQTCDECRDAQQDFAGKTREAILADERYYPRLANAFQEKLARATQR
jgi:hypothetical protein